MCKVKWLVFLGLFVFCELLEAQTQFRMYCYTTPMVPSDTNICQCFSTLSFDENTITWNNREPEIKLLAETEEMGENCWYEWSSPEVTAHVDSCVANQQPIVFCVRRKRLGVDPLQVNWNFYCKEQSSSQCPQLIYNGRTYSPPEEDARVCKKEPNTTHPSDYLWVCTLGDNDSQATYVQFDHSLGIEEGFGKEEMRFLKSIPSLFSSFARISYNLLAEDAGKPTVLTVYDIAGKLIRNLVNASGSPGRQEVVWDAKDENGNPAPPGCYFYRLRAGKVTLTTKGILLR